MINSKHNKHHKQNCNKHKDKKPSRLLVWLSTGTPVGFGGPSYYTEALGIDHGQATAARARNAFENHSTGNMRARRAHRKTQKEHDIHLGFEDRTEGHRKRQDMSKRAQRAQDVQRGDNGGFESGSRASMGIHDRGLNPVHGLSHPWNGGPIHTSNTYTPSLYPSKKVNQNRESAMDTGDRPQYRSVGTTTSPIKTCSSHHSRPTDQGIT